MTKESISALAGWKRSEADHGIMLALQLVASPRHFRERDFELVQVTLNDRQLRSLTRDLIRASRARGLDLGAAPPWWKFWRSRQII